MFETKISSVSMNKLLLIKIGLSSTFSIQDKIKDDNQNT